MTAEQPFSLADVKRLREETGAGWIACHEALFATYGDHEKAVEVLRVIRA
ncbi:UBA domain-containing protein [Nocardia aurea]